MKKFLLSGFVFLLFIIAFNAVLFFFGKANYYKDYAAIPDKKFKSFLFADSHGLPLQKFSGNYGVYNFSYASDSYFDMERKINFLLKNGYNVDTVFITVDDHTLSPYRETSNNMERSIPYTSASDFSTPYHYWKESVVRYYIPLFQPKIESIFLAFVKTKIMELIRPKKKSAEEVAAEKDWSKLNQEEKIAQSEKRKKDQFPTDASSEKLKNTLKNLIALSKENGFTLVGIKFPLTSTYLQVIGNNSYGAEQVFKENQIPVLDYKANYQDQHHLFENQDHLNDEGGKVFSEVLFSRK